MSLFTKLNQPPASRPKVTTPPSKNSGKTKWIVIAPDIFPGEDIVCVLDINSLPEAETENPGLVIYTLSEIDALTPFEHDIEFRRKIHHAKKLFGGFVKKADIENGKVDPVPANAVTV